MDAGRSRAGTLVMSSIQLKFCIDAPSNVRYNELINNRRRYGRPWHPPPHPDVAYLQMGDSVHQSDVGYTWICEDNFVPDGLGQLSRGFSDLPRGSTRLLPREDLLPSPMTGYLASIEAFSSSSSAGCSTCEVSKRDSFCCLGYLLQRLMYLRMLQGTASCRILQQLLEV